MSLPLTPYLPYLPYLPEHIQDVIYDAYVSLVDDPIIREKKARQQRLSRLYAELFSHDNFMLKSLNLELPALFYSQYTVYLSKNLMRMSGFLQDSVGTTFSLSYNRVPKDLFSLYFVFVVYVEGPSRESIHSGQKYLIEYRLNLPGGGLQTSPFKSSEFPLTFDISLRTHLVGLENRYIVNNAPTLRAGIQDGIWLFFSFAFEFFEMIGTRQMPGTDDENENKNENENENENLSHKNSSHKRNGKVRGKRRGKTDGGFSVYGDSPPRLSKEELSKTQEEMMRATNIYESVLRDPSSTQKSMIVVTEGWEDDVRHILNGIRRKNKNAGNAGNAGNTVNKRLDLLV